MNRTTYLTLFASALLLQGCAAALLVGGAAATADIAHDRRSVGTITKDNDLELSIEQSISRAGMLSERSHVNITGYNGNILLTGEADNQAIVNDIARLASQHDGVKKVINHIIVGRTSTIAERSYDIKQTAKVKTVLFDVDQPHFDPTRIKVVTEHGVTYLMGIVTQAEAQAVATTVSNVSGVRQVVTAFDIVSPTAVQ